MTDLSREAVTAAVQIADLKHLLSRHALGTIRDAARQIHDASEEIGRILDGAGASTSEKVAAIEALSGALATLVLGASIVELQTCSCPKLERVSVDFLGGPSREAGSGASPQEEKHPEAGAAPVPRSDEEIERGLVERPRGKVIDLGVRLKHHEWSTGQPRGPGGAA